MAQEEEYTFQGTAVLLHMSQIVMDEKLLRQY